ncbi:MAG: WYL domain-containing protein [Chitinophagaceae bacterium]|nr:MAG: WYL domain-containing protein [Chitinophagaceae bacterium]
MPANKSALLRYRIIDSCLTNPMRRYPTLQRMAEQIEDGIGGSISESMLNKDLAAMRSIYGAPIAYCREHRGYYYTEPGFSIREFPLTSEEISALDFSTALLHQLKGTRLFARFENAINKVIEGYRISRTLGKPESELLQVEEPVADTGYKWLEPLLNYAVIRQACAVMYEPFGRSARIHLFSPYLLKEYRNRWYAIGHSDRAGKPLVLALDRIVEIQESPSAFTASDSFDPAAFFQYAFGITQVHDGCVEEVLLAFGKEQAPYVLSQPLHPSQQLVQETTDELVIRLEVFRTYELIMTILGYGSGVRVLAPEGLRDEVVAQARSVLALYETRSPAAL